MKKKILLLLIIGAGFVCAANAQMTVSGGFTLSGVGDYVGVGANVYFDWMLPVSVPLSLGFEVGYDTADDEGSTYAIPILFRTAYHFDLAVKLDLYAVVKIGYILAYYNFGYGFDAGIAYYFSGTFGAFLEAGFDVYSSSEDGTPFSRFLTIGFSFKK